MTKKRVKMHTIKLKIQDSIYSHIMYLLKNLNPQEIEIIEDKEVTHGEDIKSSIKELINTQKEKRFGVIKDPMKWQQQQRDEW